MDKIIKIGNAQGFWGDSSGAPLRLAKQQPDLQYLTLDYLAEVSMAILAIQREKKQNGGGYAHDFIDVVRSLIPLWKSGRRLKVISNAGGLNPLGCAQTCAQVLKENGCSLKIAIVSGDDVLDSIKNDLDNPLYANMETGQKASAIAETLTTADAYLGAKWIAEALKNKADIVITGRVTDPSLTVGPCIAEFGWDMHDYDRIAGATIAGHLIECGTQVTGGISTQWLEIPEPAHLGFPIVEMHQDGSCIVTKPAETAGRVTFETVKEQLLYEIGDPACYLSPDAIVSFLDLKLAQEGINRIHVSGAKGTKPPSTCKVCATYRDGFKAVGMLAIFGHDAIKKAKRCGEIVLSRLKDAGYNPDRICIECLGSGDVVPGVFNDRQPELLECVLRICVADARKEAVECFAKEIAPLVTSGPQGVAGYISGRPKIREVFGYWPCLIRSDKIKPSLQYVEV